jgi:hypothetical protein
LVRERIILLLLILRIELSCGGTICVRCADNYDALYGDGLDFVVLDEYASMAREAWTEVLRPALADRNGIHGLQKWHTGRCTSHSRTGFFPASCTGGHNIL